MIRSAFLRRMALAAAACAFIDVPWPEHGRRVTAYYWRGQGPIVEAVVAPGIRTLEFMRALAAERVR